MARSKRSQNKNKEEVDNTKTYKLKRKKTKKHPKLRKFLKWFFIIFFVTIIICAGIAFGTLYQIFKDAEINMADVIIKYENSIVKDIDGNTIAVLSGDENREIVSISDMSPYVPKAFVAIEDERFYEHDGVDLKRTAAATVTYVLHGGKSSFGGSTITQQLVKNLTQEDERTWKRKVKEMARAYYLEDQLSKDQILELYLNLIFLGGQTYGVEIASTYYFNKSASELTLAQSAYLAGINNSPNSYSPFSEDEEDINRIKNRVRTVLAKMKELGSITEEEYNTAIAEVDTGLGFQKGTIAQNRYSYHTDAAITQVIEELQEKNDWTYEYARLYTMSSGLTIYSTQNTAIQTTMEEEAKKDKYITYSKKDVDENGNAVESEAAMVLIDHKTGYVLGTIGGLGEKTTAFGLNRATQSVRQTGSSMKPLAVLCPAIDKGIITAGTVMDDVPYLTFKNYGYSYKGLITIRYAIADSQNIPMIKSMQLLGPENSIEFLKTIGITTLDDERDNYLGLALGGLTYGISPLEMAAGYATIANDGVYIEPTFYTKVVDSNGSIVLQTEQETRTVMSSAAAYIVKEILTQPVKTGTASYAGLSGISVAAKTGTTDDDFDRWFCGFTPYYTAATWYGFDNPEEVYYSGNPSGKLWDGVMEVIHQELASVSFADTRPNGVTSATICKCSGLLATEECKNDPRGSQAYTEYFLSGSAPTTYCTCHVSATICNVSGLLANEYCTDTTTGVYITRPDADTNTAWQKAKDAEYMLTIKDYCTIHKAPVVVEKPHQEEEEEENTNTAGGNSVNLNVVDGNNTTNTTNTNTNTNTNTTNTNMTNTTKRN